MAVDDVVVAVVIDWSFCTSVGPLTVVIFLLGDDEFEMLIRCCNAGDDVGDDCAPELGNELIS